MPRADGSLQAPAHLDWGFLHEDGRIKGTIRLKPGRILWSANKGKRWYSSLRDFEAWMVEHGRRVKM